MTVEAGILPNVQTELDHGVRFFAHDGCVDYRGDRASVYVGGRLIGTFSSEEPVSRDLLVVIVCSEPTIRVGRVAEAFGVHRETIRRILDKREQHGLEGIASGHRRGRPRRQTPEFEQELFALFDEGLSVRAVCERIDRRASIGVVARVRRKWVDQRAQEPLTPKVPEPDQLEMPVADDNAEAVEAAPDVEAAEMAGNVEQEQEQEQEQEGEGEQAQAKLSDDGAQAGRDEMELEEAIEHGGRRVQHLGAWIMLAVLNAMGLYAMVEQLRVKTEREQRKDGKRYLDAQTLRVVIDAVVVALCIGKRCVEGVRWLNTPSGPTLLRRVRTISASWCRRTLSRFGSCSALELHWKQGKSLMHSAVGDDERAVFYIDNHVRPYTGKHTVRKVWRMQDKKARPGVSDFYVHDEAGRPLVRLDDPSHGSLTDWLLPTGQLLRTALGGTVKTLLVFDRGGAFPHYMAELRDDALEFVTYERAPYRVLPDKAFAHKRWIQLGPKRYRCVEHARKNLGKGRGRLRRIHVQTEGGKQLSVLAISDAPMDFLVAKLIARWPCQENQFKHQNERWGSNQLDGRRVEQYPPDAVIPNPARRRLDRQLRIAREAEGQALRRLARLREDDPKREQYEEDLEEARELQLELEALRPELPLHAAVKDTDLAGELVRHPGDYKRVIDTLRVALANAESDLAVWLAPDLPRPNEAKKQLAKLFDAPGTVRVNGKSITVTLDPAGTDKELTALDKLMPRLNAARLTLPGDPSRRQLRFQCNRK
jgi:hypothetical protein